MRIIVFLGIVVALSFVAPNASAKGSYERGRTIYQRRCAACLSIGWKWTPTTLPERRKLSLRGMAKTWSEVKVCTWMRSNTKRRADPACHPSKMSYREKLDALYYVMRRAQGPITKPKLRRRSLQVYRGPRFRKRAEANRNRALKQLRRMKALREARQQTRRSRRTIKWSPKRPAPRRPAVRRRGR
ncbi:MAG: hypothetical protein ABI333_07365 [bacterium]